MTQSDNSGVPRKMKELKDACAAGGEEPAERGRCKTRLPTERAADPDERRLRRRKWIKTVAYVLTVASVFVFLHYAGRWILNTLRILF